MRGGVESGWGGKESRERVCSQVKWRVGLVWICPGAVGAAKLPEEFLAEDVSYFVLG